MASQGVPIPSDTGPAAWAGQKVMTVTSGPGFSLMMENFGLPA